MAVRVLQMRQLKRVTQAWITRPPHINEPVTVDAVMLVLAGTRCEQVCFIGEAEVSEPARPDLVEVLLRSPESGSSTPPSNF